MRPNSTKTLSLLLSLLILLQGCVAYKKSPVGLAEMARINDRAKVVTKDGETHRFRYIILKDSVFYGVKSTSKNLVNIPLTESEIDAVYPTSETGSTILFLGGLLASFGLLYLACGDWCY